MIQSQDFFRNLKPSQIPTYDPNRHCFEQSSEVLDFWKEEYRKCRDGVIIDGVPIHGIIYYYINHYRTSFEIGKVTLPDFRDTEWFFNELFLEAEGKYGIFAFGSRRIGKTGLISCMLDWGSTFFFNSQNYFVYGEEVDRNSLVKYLDASLTYKNPAFNVPILKGKVDSDKEVSFGLKLKGINKSYKQSTINFINTENGSPKGSLKAAGGTPKTWVYDEGGKYPLKALLKQARPAWRTNQGELRCLPMIVGCLTAGNKVWTNTGKLVNIENLEKEQGILGFSGEKYLQENINWFKPPEYKECVEIITQSDSIKCSIDHPLMVERRTPCGKSKYCEIYRADQIKKGDKLILIDKVDLFGEVNQSDAYLLGLMIGDGTSSGGNVSIAVNEQEIEDFLFNNYDCKTYKHKITKTNPSGCKTIGVRGVQDIFREEDILNKTGLNKTFPKFIGSYDKESLSEFIAGYFDADGNIKVKDNRNVSVVLTSKCEHLLEDMKYYLLKFGIHSVLQKEYRKEGYKEGNIYRLYINKYIDVVRFFEEIPVKIKNKWKRKHLLEEVKFRNIRGLKSFKFQFNEDFPKGEFFKGKRINNVRIDTVKKVKNIGEELVYNLNTSISHSYLTGSYISMNTGGDAEMSVEAFEILQNPTSFGFLNMNWDVLERGIDPEYVTWKRKNFGFFLPAQISISGKKDDSNLGDFLEKDSENLKKIDLKVTDWKESYRLIHEIREASRANQTAYNGEVMGYPFDTDEPFLFSEENPFLPNELKQWKGELIAMGEGMNKMTIERNIDTGELKLEPSDKNLIVDFPFKSRTHDAPVVIYEPPPKNEIPMYTYVMGIDPYKYVDSTTESVGACYVYKRFNGMGETRDILVASYASRPKDQDGTFHETCLRLAEIYNARIIAERNDEVFIKYVIGKKKEHLFERETGIQGMLRPDSKNTYTKLGVYVTAKEKDYMLGLVKKYITEEIDIDENGNPILGYRRIKDLMLLEELIMYRPKENVDRIVAFGLALLGEDYFSKVGIIPKKLPKREDEEKKSKVVFKNKMVSKNSRKFKHKWKN